jgi:hypothetical protein
VPALRTGADGSTEARRGKIHAALAGVHARRSLLVSAWIRTPANDHDSPSPLTVLVGGQHGFPSAPGADLAEGRRSVLFPPGAEGVAVALRSVSDMLSAFPLWTRYAGRPAIVARQPSGEQPRPNRSGPAAGGLEERLAHIGHVPFAWLVVAEPAADDEVEAERRMISNAAAGLADRSQQAGLGKLRLEAAEERLRELARQAETAFWRIHAFVGATTSADLAFLAPLLVSGVDVGDLPYSLHCGRSPSESLVEMLSHPVIPHSLDGTEESWALASSPFLGSSELLAALARPPERELYGIRTLLPNEFDKSPEHGAVSETAERSVVLGRVLDAALTESAPFLIPLTALNRHTLVCGATGAGKSQTVRQLLEELTDVGIPWLVIEPAKAEYRRMAGRLRSRFGTASDVTVLRIGDPTALPVLVNPLEPERGFPVQTHVDLTIALFLAAFEADEPFPQVLAEAMRRCYAELGWDLALGEYKRARWSTPGHQAHRFPSFPTLGELQATAQEVVRDIGYGDEVTRNVRGFIDVRLGSLRLGTPGRFFEGGHPLDFAGLLSRNTVIEIEDVGNDQDKAFVIGTILIRLMERLRLDHADDEGPPPLQHVTVVEEAHRLLRNRPETKAAVHAVEMFASLLAEVRAYGEGLVIAEQIPTKVLSDVVKNTAVQVLHRLPADDDRAFVGAAMNLSEEQSQFTVSLQPGNAAAFAEGMDRPILVRVPAGEDRESGLGCRTDLPLLGVRSAACPAVCRADPCRADRLGRAGLVVEGLPDVVLWCELAVVAHLTGNIGPVLRSDVLHRMSVEVQALCDPLNDDEEQRLLACALASVIQRSVSLRRAWLAEYFDPAAFAEHLRERLSAALLSKPVEAPADPRWQAGAYRFVDVWRSLSSREPVPPKAVKEWRAARGIDVPDGSREERAAYVRTALPMTFARTLDLLYGTPDGKGRTEIERAAVALRPETALDKRLDLAVAKAVVPDSANEVLARLWPWLGGKP